MSVLREIREEKAANKKLSAGTEILQVRFFVEKSPQTKAGNYHLDG